MPSEFLQLRGYAKLAPRLVSGAPGNFFNVGCPSVLNLALNEETFEIKEKCSGIDGVALRGVLSQGAEVSLSFYKASRRNLMLALQGTDVPAQTSAAVTNEILPTGIIAGESIRLGGINGHQNITALVLTDAGGPLVLGTDYTLNAASAMVDFLVTPVAPVDADYTYDDLPKVAMFTAGSIEYWLHFDARNKVDNFAPAVAEFYKIRFSPLANLDLLPDEVSQFELTGGVLIDTAKATDDPLGQFGWISYVP